MTRTIFAPVGYAEAADRIAELVERGVIKLMPHWLSREACQSFIDSLPLAQRDLYAPTAALVRLAGEAAQAAVPPSPGPLSMVENRDGVRLSSKPKGDRDAA